MIPENSNSEENIYNNENEAIQTSRTNSNNILDKLEGWNNLTFLTGNAMAATGNGLLWYNGILPAGPAVCFIADGTVGTLTSLSRLVMYNLDYKNKNIDKLLMWINLSQFPLLNAAVIQLNWTGLNPEYKSVWGCFIPSASIATVNSVLAIAKICYNSNDGEQQPSNWKKKLYNSLGVINNTLPIIGVNLALTGVINMSQIYLNQHQDDENKNNAEIAFYSTAAGIGIVSAAVLFNTVMQLKKSLFKNNTENREPLIIEEQIQTLSNNFDNNVIDINNYDATFSQQTLNNGEPLDTKSVHSEDLLIASQYGKNLYCPPCSIL
ncbi:hypothetical protein [Spiroplasma sp. AdecLV25b]|uniref:hypothetical protein n=1 Tax=Spiroplasma sp. AdecLV25b TaxID=3027162 RepID=UPI0027E1B597|nr:hypothetical protein [Spiroplasma sp. AdecLV25b]